MKPETVATFVMIVIINFIMLFLITGNLRKRIEDLESRPQIELHQKDK